MEWSSRQTGDRKAAALWEADQRHRLGPAAAAASTDRDHHPHLLYRDAVLASPSQETLDEPEAHRRRRVGVAQAQALGEAFAAAIAFASSSSARDTKATAATELWSPRGLRRRPHASSLLSPSSSTRTGRNHQPLRDAKHTSSSLSRSRPQPLLLHSPPPTSPTRSSFASPPPSATMMEVNVVPSVVLHFHGFRSSLLSNLTTACYRICLDIVKRSLQFIAACIMLAAIAAAIKALVLSVLYWTFQGVTVTGSVLAVFLTTEAVAVVWGNKHSNLFHDDDSVVLYAQPVSPSLKPTPMAVAVPTLPRLNLPSSIAVVPEMSERSAVLEKMHEGELQMENSSHFLFPRPAGQLLATRRRILANLREPVNLNAVRGERRRRADVVLHKSKVGVGKAFLDPIVQAARANTNKVKPVDVYMVRVDCSTPDDKHMNPVVMWDFTATFEDFRTLEKNMRTEMKAKRLRNITVPHLSSGAILFVQPELTQDVLAKRRERLQTFVAELCSDAVLADCDAMRKFCQAF